MKRRIMMVTALALALAFGGLVASSASADKPQDITFQFPPVGPDGNPLAFDSPCTGELVSVSGLFTVTGKIHMHDGRIVGHGTQTAETDQGHVLNGITHVTENSNNASNWFNDRWVHPETGEKFRVHGFRKFDLTTSPPTLRIQKFDVTCQGKPA